MTDGFAGAAMEQFAEATKTGKAFGPAPDEESGPENFGVVPVVVRGAPESRPSCRGATQKTMLCVVVSRRRSGCGGCG